MVGGRTWSWFACLFLCMVSLPCRAQSDAANEWKRKLIVQLQANARFPPEACHKNGEANVAFILDRTGKLISTSIVSGTGVPALDKAVLDMVERAQPFPPAPPDVTDGALEIIATVPFKSSRSCGALGNEDKVRAAMRGVCRGC
jgi:periplasmic protein TonB